MSIEAMKQALNALEMLARYENPETRIQVRKPKDGGPIVTMYPHKVATDAADVLRTAIAEAEKQEPVAWMFEKPTFWNRTPQKFFTDSLVGTDGLLGLKPLYTTPPAARREWVGLTDEQINQYDYQYRDILYDAEKMLRENNA